MIVKGNPRKSAHSWSYNTESGWYTCNCGCGAVITLELLARFYRLTTFNPAKIGEKYLSQLADSIQRRQF